MLIGHYVPTNLIEPFWEIITNISVLHDLSAILIIYKGNYIFSPSTTIHNQHALINWHID